MVRDHRDAPAPTHPPEEGKQNESGLSGKKFDTGKLEWHLLPPEIALVVWVLMDGKKDYGEGNWEEGMDWSRLYDAAKGHIEKFWCGESLDKKSDKHHLAHAICCLLFLLAYDTREIAQDGDDRPEVRPSLKDLQR